MGPGIGLTLLTSPIRAHAPRALYVGPFGLRRYSIGAMDYGGGRGGGAVSVNEMEIKVG
jgi:hypothetical protein